VKNIRPFNKFKQALRLVCFFLITSTNLKKNKMENSNQSFTTGIWNVKKGKEQEFITAWKELADWTFKTMDGGSAHLLQDSKDQSRFISVGTWTSENNIQKWRETTQFKTALEKINNLLVEPSQPQNMKEVATVGEKAIA
jgi:heme-degrading monooxygenase HmoA